LISCPLEPYPAEGGSPGISTLDKIIGNQLTGHPYNRALSDKIEILDNADGLIRRAWFQTGTINKWKDWDTGGSPTFGIIIGRSYYFDIMPTNTLKNIFFCGRVIKTSRAIGIKIGRNYVGWSYPISCTLAKSGLVECGFTGHPFNRALSDNVEFWNNLTNSYERFWFDSNPYPGKWEPWNVGDPMRDISIGESFWVNVISTHSPFTWIYHFR